LIPSTSHLLLLTPLLLCLLQQWPGLLLLLLARRRRASASLLCGAGLHWRINGIAGNNTWCWLLSKTLLLLHKCSRWFWFPQISLLNITSRLLHCCSTA
jgi:hypothetical protein